MFNNTEKKLSSEILNPMLRLLASYEISNYYNYLPGMGKDSYDYAWGFYYNKLNEIHKKIRDNTYLSEVFTDFLMKTYEDLEHIISEEGGVDRLSKKWYVAEPKLMCFTSRAELFAGLKNEDAYDTIDKFDFDIHDVIIDRFREGLLEDDLSETEMLMVALINMVAAAAETEMNTNKLISYMAHYINKELMLGLSQEELLQAKAIAEQVDIEEIQKEAEFRLSILENKRGAFRRTESFDDEAKKLIDDERFYTYHIIREPDAAYYLGIEASKLYWKNHRSGRFVQCYRVAGDTETFKIMPVEVRDGELRIWKGWEQHNEII